MTKHNHEKFALKVLLALFENYINDVKEHTISQKPDLDIFLLILKEGKTYAQVAEKYRIHEKTVRSSFNSTLLKLELFTQNISNIIKDNYELTKANKWLTEKLNECEVYIKYNDTYQKEKKEYLPKETIIHKLKREYKNLINIPDQLLNTNLKDVDISLRICVCLKENNINTIGDLLKYDKNKLLEFKKFGISALLEVEDMLTKLGLRLGMLKDSI